MSECHITGCKHMETRCIDCGRLVSEANFEPQWISVKDRLPQENEWIYLGNSIYELTTWGIFIDGCFVNPDLDYLKISGVSHWMPLPTPPEKLDE